MNSNLQRLVAGTQAMGSGPEDAELAAIAKKQGKTVEQLLASTPGATPEEKAQNAKQAGLGIQSLNDMLKAQGPTDSPMQEGLSESPSAPSPNSMPEEEVPGSTQELAEKGWLAKTKEYYDAQQAKDAPQSLADRVGSYQPQEEIKAEAEALTVPPPKPKASVPGVAVPEEASFKEVDSPNMEELVKRYQQEESDIRGPIKKEFTERRQTLQDQIAQARAGAASDSNRNEWMQVAEKVGHALAQYGAGLQGVRTGVDMSGLKFDKVDWERRLDRIQASLNSDLNRMENSANKLDSEERLKTKEATQVPKEVFDARVKDAMNAYRTKLAQSEREYGADSKARENALEEKRRRERDQLEFDRRKELEGMRMDGRSELADKRAAGKAEAGVKPDKEALKAQQQWDKDSAELQKSIYAAVEGDSKAKVKAAADVQKYAAKIGLSPEDAEALTEKLKSSKSGFLGIGDNRKETAAEMRALLSKAKRPQVAAPGTGAPSEPGAASPAPVAGGMVKMRAPNGAEKLVPSDKVEYFKSKGATVVP